MPPQDPNAPKQRLLIEFPGVDLAPAELPRRGKLILGSSRERADVVLDGAGVEPVHCTIRALKHGGWALVDMGSDIGTRVNGRIADKVRLAHGDVLSLGQARVRIVDPTAPAQSQVKDRNHGTRISGYRIDGTLGRGGMGQVYLALQERLDRQVALKILPPALAADGEFVRQFQGEARAAAALNHPNIVTVFDVGEEGGRHFLSMEYMHAGCLETRLAREGPLPWKQVLDILHDAASGLVYAESRGIVHRDIKPSNLMQNEDGTTKIADLGLAMRTGQDEGHEEAQPIYGTPHFIAPELIHGEKPDCRSDLYSLGATAYRLLTGETPFEGQSPREILRNVLNETPRPVASLAPEAPRPLQAAIERLLSRSPEDRYPSAAILLRDVDQMRTAGTGEVLPGNGSGSHAAKAVLLGAAILLVGAGGWYLSTQRGDHGNTPDPAASPSTQQGAGEDAAVRSEDFQGLVFADDEQGPTLSAGDDDMAARLLEAEAEVEYLKLGESVLPDEEREQRLLELAERYKGTNSAFRALEQLASDREARSAALAREEADNRLTEEALESLRAATLGIEDHRVRTALQAVRAIDPPTGLGNAARFKSLRDSIEDGILERGIAYAEDVVQRADALAASGDFEGVERLLNTFSSSIELPELLDGEVPSARAQALERLATTTYARLGQLEVERKRWFGEQVGIDRRAVAVGLRTSDGLATRLAAFDFSGAIALIEATAEGVHTPGAQASLEALRGHLQGARLALEALGSTWDEGAWRRKSIAIPDDTRSSKGDAIGADVHGILVGDDGSTRHIPWAAWVRHPRELHVLFNERLERPWSTEEVAGIADLFRIGAVAEAARWASATLDGRPPEDLGPEEALEYFDQAQAWADPANSGTALEGERRALELLVESLAARDAGNPTLATARLERLLDEHSTSLFVLLLSDGEEWRLDQDKAGRTPDADGPAPMDPSAEDPSAEDR